MQVHVTNLCVFSHGPEKMPIRLFEIACVMQLLVHFFEGFQTYQFLKIYLSAFSTSRCDHGPKKDRPITWFLCNACIAQMARQSSQSQPLTSQNYVLFPLSHICTSKTPKSLVRTFNLLTINTASQKDLSVRFTRERNGAFRNITIPLKS